MNGFVRKTIMQIHVICHLVLGIYLQFNSIVSFLHF